MSLKELQELQGQAAKEIRAMADKSADWTAEDKEKWDRVNADYDARREQIEKLQRAKDVETEMEKRVETIAGKEDFDGSESRQKATGIDAETRALAIQCWAGNREMSYSNRHYDAAKKCGVNINARSIMVPMLSRSQMEALRTEKRTDYYNAKASGYGSELVPQGIAATIERALLKYGGPRQVARIIRTATGESIVFPTINDTSNSGAAHAEVDDSTDSAIGEQVVATSSKTIGAYTYTSEIVRVSKALLADSAYDFEAELGNMLGERCGRGTAALYTTGTGSSEPQGFITGGALGNTATSATAFTADEIIDLEYSVDPAYREGDSVCFQAHNNTVKAIRKLKNDNGDYIWQRGLAGEPDTLDGYKLIYNQHMASSVAASAKVLAFGDFSKFLIRDVGVIELVRLDERYAEYNQVAFLAIMRTDSLVLDAGTYPIKYMAMHA